MKTPPITGKGGWTAKNAAPKSGLRSLCQQGIWTPRKGRQAWEWVKTERNECHSLF